MDIENIRKTIEGRKAKPLGVKWNYAVLVPLIKVDDELHILYELRSTELNTQPGEISFPGGHVEKGETYKEASIRETYEELNIDKNNIEILGELDYIASPFNFMLYSYCGILKDIDTKSIKPNKAEVDHVFTVPVDYFINNAPRCHYIELEAVTHDNFPYHLIQNGENYNWRKGKYPVYFYLYEDYIIWGMTARITKSFIDVLKGTK